MRRRRPWRRFRSGSTLGAAILAALSLILDLHRHPWLLAGLRSLPTRNRRHGRRRSPTRRLEHWSRRRNRGPAPDPSSESHYGLISGSVSVAAAGFSDSMFTNTHTRRHRPVALRAVTESGSLSVPGLTGTR